MDFIPNTNTWSTYGTLLAGMHLGKNSRNSYDEVLSAATVFSPAWFPSSTACKVLWQLDMIGGSPALPDHGSTGATANDRSASGIGHAPLDTTGSSLMRNPFFFFCTHFVTHNDLACALSSSGLTTMGDCGHHNWILSHLVWIPFRCNLLLDMTANQAVGECRSIDFIFGPSFDMARWVSRIRNGRPWRGADEFHCPRDIRCLLHWLHYCILSRLVDNTLTGGARGEGSLCGSECNFNGSIRSYPWLFTARSAPILMHVTCNDRAQPQWTGALTRHLMGATLRPWSLFKMGAMMGRRRKLSFSLCISMCVHVRARGGVQTRVYTPEPILFSASVGPLRIYIIMQPTKSGCSNILRMMLFFWITMVENT